MRPWLNKSLSFGILGLFLIALGISFCFLWPTVFHQILQKELALSPTSRSFEMWKDTSNLPPMFMKIYFFNWTNPEELNIKKPHFNQVGPYYFKEVRQKSDIKFNHENKTVSYVQRRIWYFDEERSNGSLSDVITNLDAVTVSGVHKIRFWEVDWQKSLSFLLSSTNRRYYISKTVDELLFTGYSDNLLTMGKMMPIDDVPAFDRFGWFYTRNNSDMDGHLNMETGEDDISQLGILRKWNYRDTTKFFKSPCNVIEGSAGGFWPPYRTKNQISLFSVEICRTITYEYEGTVSHFGIEGYRYTIDKKTLGNDTRRRYPHEQAKYFERTTTTEDFFAAEHLSEMGITTTTESVADDSSSEKNTNEYSDDDPDVINMGNCYCDGECTPSGLMNVTACRFGAPAFISLPHFYKGDSMLLDQVGGLHPNDKDHSFTVTLEPMTGIPLEVIARFQINLLLQPSETVTVFNNVPKIYMPMFWFELKVKISEDMASDLRKLLALPTVMLSIGIAMIAIGLGLIATTVFLYFKNKRRVPTTDVTEKAVDESSDKKTEMVYMDKTSSNNEDPNVRGDRRLYAKLY
ncbi:PREDICTED: protein croquemort-like [Cyphomyrmex costatus]|uniref:Protein croquemort n=1 Tax=Cyphomyrmex costatus TaxID=456900 RepID=A0A195D0V5_9HYME|nr:PREDICTED: protein croquemort-like [Cyphomyrmex costatus]XP_018406892.1 PREDICTED: protein croquemort-like [Cyphomyrmex costatus]KYN06540.1 Protein croquemort [Cyphomyrmex costatus]